ncbi:MAG: 3-dehydroquinate synthase [Clostridia bacterium]|nr:3-dehydroquinate synthase [Clostridia bacterium]
MEKITVKTPTAESVVYVGSDVFELRLPVLLKGQKNFVVTDSTVKGLYAEWFEKWFADCEIFVLPAGEENKNFQSLSAILQKMAEAGLHRNSRLFAVGGGVVGDIGGLAASLYMRGISYVQIPTTLLAQVDSGVGGKTAVNLNGVKNIIGAFYQPCEVLVSPEFLKTLPKREIKCGLGEILKYAGLSGEIFDGLQSQTGLLSELSFLENFILKCIRHKGKVVEQDEKETGERISLNLGHTTAHAIETESECSHGECVLWGMYFETQIALEKDVCEKDYGECLLELIDKTLWERPISRMDFSKIEKNVLLARLDKKNADDGMVKLVVPKAKGEWTVLALPFEEYKGYLLELASQI